MKYVKRLSVTTVIILALSSLAYAQKIGSTQSPVLSYQVGISNPYASWSGIYLSENGNQWRYVWLRPNSNDAYTQATHLYYWDGYSWRYAMLARGNRYALNYYAGRFQIVQIRR